MQQPIRNTKDDVPSFIGRFVGRFREHWRIFSFRVRQVILRVFDEVFPVFLRIVAAIALVAILVAASLFPSFDSLASRETVLTQAGAIYGTIFALVLTLSLLPVQKASESWSPSVVRL